MTLDEVLASLFGTHTATGLDGPILFGEASLGDGEMVHLIGFTGGVELGVDHTIALAARVIEIAGGTDDYPILFLVDSSSQKMSRRDELMGLSEYLAHLAKSLLLAEGAGHRTIGLLYGGSAAGAFIATVLSCQTLVALPGAHPAVMDLPSMSKVTKLPLEILEERAKATPVFAPGLDNLAQTGAIAEIWDISQPLGPQLAAVLAKPDAGDTRAQLGFARGGRKKAAPIAAEIVKLATAGG
ncbi:biotin-independent malonate decarboxylase subunit gamma [Sphingomonas sp. M1-B02]|uniref:biotin-independent malonate decarboxylase subunit gamma n=1 Tax=Sphingomonas sp. M1-B02 TaxID=3114300 RepID=UPI00223F1844|nr:biotin-independent malonate decarboxylase subunit gamma [Sphingomonas sp. S6-11]UZK66302.1 biotin-independent malonate decarboxylase subunit gamma [Sphingomonas sp. S6-11]